MPFKLTSELGPRQRDCSIVLKFNGEVFALSFDDAIEFKIQITHVLETSKSNDRMMFSEAGTWSAQIVANSGGFEVAFEQSPTSTVKLWLNARQAEAFSADLQRFIDAAGALS